MLKPKLTSSKKKETMELFYNSHGSLHGTADILIIYEDPDLSKRRVTEKN